MLKWNSISYYI